MSRHVLAVRIEKLSAVQKVWQKLFDQTPGATPFMSYEWFTALADNLLKADPDVLLFYWNTRAVGIFPGNVKGNTLQFIGDERVTDIIDMIYLPGQQDVVVGLLARHVLENDLRMNLYPLDENSPLVTGLAKEMPGAVVEKKDACPLLDLASSWDEYLSGLDGKARHELRRKLKKVNGVTTKDVQPADIQRLFDLMSAGDSDKDDFLNEEIRSFFGDVALTFADKGWLRMREAAMNTRVLGILLAFGFDERVYLFNMGHNVELRNLSPGIVTVALDIRSAIDEGYQYYDFLRGDEEYKYRLGAARRYTMRVLR